MITLRPFLQLDQTLVDQNRAQATQDVQEDNTTLDLRRGPLSDLLVYYHALLAAQRQANINDYLNARSLKQLTADPTLADPDLVDDVLSNYFLTRLPGSAAGGEITVVVDSDVTVTIAQGSTWQAHGQIFQTTEVFTAKAQAAQVVSPGDRLLTPTSDGNWAFNITVVADVIGTAGMLKRDTAVIPDILPPSYLTSYAASDFTGGTDPEDNTALMVRLQQGIAAKTMGNRVNMMALLRQTPEFAGIPVTSIVGYGDPEMLRDRHWIFPVSGGGRVDWYVRSNETMLTLTLQKQCTLLTKNSDGTSVWQAALTRDDVPGFYEVVDVVPLDSGNVAGGFTVTSDVRTLDISGYDFAPDVLPKGAEWIYTRFQTAIIQFLDTATDVSALAVGASVIYQLAVRYLPLIKDLQDFVLSRDIRCYGADCLIKAAVPCFMQLSFTVHKVSGQDDPDVNAIAIALAAEVNAVGFIGELYASRLQSVVSGLLLPEQRAGAIDMMGRLRYPNGAVRWLRSNEVLTIPDDPANMVSLRTVQFFLAPEDVAISVVAAVPSNL